MFFYYGKLQRDEASLCCRAQTSRLITRASTETIILSIEPHFMQQEVFTSQICSLHYFQAALLLLLVDDGNDCVVSEQR